MRAQSYEIWWTVKGKIIERFGSVVACAHKLQCSSNGIRMAVSGQCPGIAEKLKEAIDFDWEATQPA